MAGDPELGFAVRGDECVEWGMGTDGAYGLVWLGVTRKAHRAFKELAEGPSELGALHRCGNKLCINLDHTYWGTQAENVADQFRLGENTQHGESHDRAKLTYSGVAEMRQRHAEGQSIASLAREFGVSHGAASKAIRGLTWQH